MKPIRMTPRRWFWTLFLGVAGVMLLNQRFAGASRDGGSARGGPGWVQTSLATILMPVEAPLRWGQEKFERMGSDLAGGDVPTLERLRQLEAENRLLEQQRNYYQWVVQRDEEQFRELNRLRSFRTLFDQKMVSANVREFGTGPGETVIIDRGRDDGIREGDLVMSQLSVVGRVVAVSARVSTVRLITDPHPSMQVIAQLVRQTPTVRQTLVELCQVRGMGNGMLRCDSISAAGGTIPPEHGDILLVADNDWPLAKGTELGRVVEVSRLDRQNLRYDLKIMPMANLSKASKVDVVIDAKR